jgi:hypothetical protein
VGAEVGAKVGAGVAVFDDDAGTKAMSSSQTVPTLAAAFDVMAIPVTAVSEATPKLEIGTVIRLHWLAGTEAGKLTDAMTVPAAP